MHLPDGKIQYETGKEVRGTKQESQVKREKKRLLHSVG